MGGLIPCPAAITVLLPCMQMKQFSLGVALVLCFGVGLAITMVGGHFGRSEHAPYRTALDRLQPVRATGALRFGGADRHGRGLYGVAGLERDLAERS